jgi:tetratricopeptide (TPR) repeat protein
MKTLILFVFSVVALAGDSRIEMARKSVQANPASAQAYNDLAAAFCRQGRDTDDAAAYDQAEAAVKRSLELSPGNLDALRWRVTALLGKQEYAAALELAKALNKKIPDDIGFWALLSEIHAALGDYTESERCAQWVLDLRRNNPLGFVKAAELRELFGDFDGAEDFYQEALRRTSQADLDERAWLLTQSARMQVRLGNARRAGSSLDQAQQWYPASLQILAVRAQLAQFQKNYAEAAALLEKRAQAVPDAAHLYDLALAQEQAGQHDRAAETFREFEGKARAGMPQLVLYYADYRKDAARALSAAGARQDVATLDARAWALYRNDKVSEAKAELDRALAVGVRDAGYFCHASQIAARLNDAAGAQKFAKEAESLNPAGCGAAQ